MMKHKFCLFALVLLLTPSGSAFAQPSTNYVTQRSVMTGGGSANSASYAVISVIGQPATAVVKSASYKVTGGFLHAQRQESEIGHKLWLPVILK